MHSCVWNNMGFVVRTTEAHDFKHIKSMLNIILGLNQWFLNCKLPGEPQNPQENTPP